MENNIEKPIATTEVKTKETNPGEIIPKIIGYILLTPALVSVFLFFKELFGGYGGHTETLQGFAGATEWTGYQGASSIPFYFGLMAIAGAYLIKSKPKTLKA